MEGQQTGVRIALSEPIRTDANRAVQECCDALLERLGDDLVASTEKNDAGRQVANATLVRLFGGSAAVALAQRICAYLSPRAYDRDGTTIGTADGTEVISIGEVARNLDSRALVRAAERASKKS